ncbi:MAG TPA: ABC transporter ATP-binding protein [Thermodesulfobacteriota bacterium]|nr:ABC transporter ATP-binding protein [Thermodesulfobacteriota bacterium]
MLKTEGLRAGYGRTQVLHDISIEVDEGEVVCLLGANGAGKSTLLGCISGVVSPTRGKVFLRGADVTGLAPDQMVRRGVCHVPEGKQIFQSLTVWENLKLGSYSYARRASRLEIESGMEKIFVLFPRLKERKAQLAGTLSGGEQQMLAIGRALMGKPKLLLTDEPSLGLAPLIIREIFKTVETLRQQGLTILLVEQNVRVALQVADRGYVMQNGAIALQGGCEQLANSELVAAAYLGKQLVQKDGEDHER